MKNVIFETSWKERQRFEDELLKIASQEIKLFKGRLMSWYSNTKEPYLNQDFIDSLSEDKKTILQDLIKSL